MRSIAAIIVIAACLAGCWQAAGITLKDLPVRDGNAEFEEGETDTAEVDEDPFDVPEADLTDPIHDPQPDDILADDPASDETPAGMSAEAYCAGLQEAWCRHLESCCNEQELASLQDPFDCADPAASMYVAACIDRMAQPIAAGSIVIDEAAFLEACQPMLSLSSDDCPGLGFFSQAFDELFETYCGGVVDGNLPLGQPCGDRLECDGDLCCSSGACAECMMDGGDCTANDQCAAGLRCIDRACLPPGEPGEICDEADDLELSDCMAGTWCDRGQCQPLLEGGQPCVIETTIDPCMGMCSPEGSCIDFCSSGGN